MKALRNIFALLLIGVSCNYINGQENTIETSLESFDKHEFRILNIYPDSFPVVSVIFKAEREGEPVWNLPIEDVVVLENYEACEVISLEPISKREPIKINIIFDHSSSMAMDRSQLYDSAGNVLYHYDRNFQVVFNEDYTAPVEHAKIAAKEFIATFDPKKDYVGLIGFSTHVDMEVSSTQDTALLFSVINTIEPSGFTALYDAIMEGIIGLEKEEGIRVCAVLTDGNDNSSESSVEKVVEKAVENEIPLFIIGLGQVNIGALDSLAHMTSGDFFHTHKASSLDSIYAVISRKIQAFYDLRYKSPNLSSVDSLREVKLVYKVAEEFLMTDSTSIQLPDEVIVYLKNKEKEKKYMLFGGILSIMLLSAGVLYATFKKKPDVTAGTPQIEKVYPNPSNGEINVVHSGKGKELVVRDINGREIKRIVLHSNHDLIDLSDLRGVYIIQIALNGAFSNGEKIIIDN